MNFDKETLQQKIATAREKVGPLIAKAREQVAKLSEKSSTGLDQIIKPKSNATETPSSLTKILTGATGALGEYYFPPELIGGTCPHIPGEEEEIVWNAAAEACDTERVHVVWQTVENKLWYLAVRSGEIASHPNTWCPFASVLPGMKDAVPPPVCYTHYDDESASMMLLTTEGLQIYRGTSLVVRAKAERSAREIGDAPIIELVPDKILQLAPVPWYSVSLFEDRARRVLGAVSVFSALAVASLAFVIWLIASMSLIAAKHDLTETKIRTQNKTTQLMQMSEKLRASPMRDQLAKFTDLNDNLIVLNGLLEVYEIKDNKPRWRAVVPPSVTADRINELGGKNIENTTDGVAIGNAAQIDFEAVAGGKK
ncbi:MAG TPA: hypothetical protein VFR09_04225 [Alphaproteobacteria bacterium]|nr:hypothetical protein [Alphaproteobacteria bacterium]